MDSAPCRCNIFQDVVADVYIESTGITGSYVATRHLEAIYCDINRCNGHRSYDDESVIVGTVTITAVDVTVNGFKMTSSYIAAGYPSALNVNISYNILENVTATWGAIHLHGTPSSYHECDGGYIGYNTIIGAVGDGIWTVGN